jgi:hypothetical protein
MPVIFGPGTKPATGGSSELRPDGYVYHTFTTSGNFIPASNSTIDILIVGGGGESGGTGNATWNHAGGGGGGSVFSSKWQKVTAGYPYPVIVGLKGIRGTLNGSFGTPGGTSIFNSPGGDGVASFTAPGGAGGASATSGTNDGMSAGPNNPVGSSGGGNSSRWGSSQSIGAGFIGAGFPSTVAVGWDNSPGSIAGSGGGAGSVGTFSQSPIRTTGGNGLPISTFTANFSDIAGVGGSGNSDGGVNLNPQITSSPTKYGHGGSAGPAIPNSIAGSGVVIIRYAIS